MSTPPGPVYSADGTRESLPMGQFAQHTADVMKFTLRWKNNLCHTLSFLEEMGFLNKRTALFPL